MIVRPTLMYYAAKCVSAEFSLHRECDDQAGALAQAQVARIDNGKQNRLVYAAVMLFPVHEIECTELKCITSGPKCTNWVVCVWNILLSTIFEHTVPNESAFVRSNTHTTTEENVYASKYVNVLECFSLSFLFMAYWMLVYFMLYSSASFFLFCLAFIVNFISFLFVLLWL